MSAADGSLLERLVHLSAQRTARTDRLQEQVHALLAVLAQHVDLDVPLFTNDYTLVRCREGSPLLSVETWRFGDRGVDRDDWCHLDRPVGSSGSVAGDLRYPFRGPLRGELVAFAKHARVFVQAALDRVVRDAIHFTGAEVAVAEATATLTGSRPCATDECTRRAHPASKEGLCTGCQAELWEKTHDDHARRAEGDLDALERAQGAAERAGEVAREARGEKGGAR